jgi:hypothetical protein
MKTLLKYYLVITAVMVVNFGVIYGVLYLIDANSHSEQEAYEPANGDNIKLQENLSRISQQSFDGYHANLRQILASCGVPDGAYGSIDGDLNLIYYYDRFGTKDWAAYVTLKNGFFTGVGYNDSKVNDYSIYKKWDYQDSDIPTYR